MTGVEEPASSSQLHIVPGIGCRHPAARRRLPTVHHTYMVATIFGLNNNAGRETLAFSGQVRIGGPNDHRAYVTLFVEGVGIHTCTIALLSSARGKGDG